MSVRDLFDRKLGFGTMRLPLDAEGKIDYPQFCEMIDTFMDRGFTYFDTAYPYHEGQSEIAVRECLVKRHPRDSFKLATKLPLWNAKTNEDIRKTFDHQLEKTGAGFFDLYLIHCLEPETYATALKTDAFSFVLEKKKEGFIKHCGFSFHGTAELLEEILTKFPEMEFVQLQINYYDWESDDVQARLCHEVCEKHGKPVIVMEPVKGGSLVNLPDSAKSLLPDQSASTASYAIRFAASQKQVMVVLSGMSDLEQLKDNTSYMMDFKPLSEEETKALEEVTRILRSVPTIPCTACRYCVEGCPMGIVIPSLFAFNNKQKRFNSYADPKAKYLEITKGHGLASECIQCGQCEEHCPQHISIRDNLVKIAEEFE